MAATVAEASSPQGTFGPASASLERAPGPVPILSAQPPGPQYISGSPMVGGLHDQDAFSLQDGTVEELIESLRNQASAPSSQAGSRRRLQLASEEGNAAASPASPSFGAAATTVPDLQDETGGQNRVLKAAQAVELGERFSHTTPARPTPTDEDGAQLSRTPSVQATLHAGPGPALQLERDSEAGGAPPNLQDMSHTALASPAAPLTYAVRIERNPPQGAPPPPPGEHVGVGINIASTAEGLFLITAVAPRGPAAQHSTLLLQHVISRVDGEPVAGLALQDVITRIKGPPATTVTLTVSREAIGPAAGPGPERTVSNLNGAAAAPGAGNGAQQLSPAERAASTGGQSEQGKAAANGNLNAHAAGPSASGVGSDGGAGSGGVRYKLGVVVPPGAQAGQALMSSRFVIAQQDFGSAETGAATAAGDVCVLLKEGTRGWILLQTPGGEHAWYPKSYAVVFQPMPYTVPANCPPGTRLQLAIPSSMVEQAMQSKAQGAAARGAPSAQEASAAGRAHANGAPDASAAAAKAHSRAESLSTLGPLPPGSGPQPPLSVINPAAPAGMADGTPIVSSDAAAQPVVWIHRAGEAPGQDIHVMHIHVPSLQAMGLGSFAPIAKVAAVAGETAAHIRALPGMSNAQLQAWQHFGFTQEHVPPQAVSLVIPAGGTPGMQMQASPYKTLVGGFPVTYLFKLPPGAKPGAELKLHLPRLIIPHYGPHGLFVQHLHLPQVGMPSIRLPAFTDFDLGLLARNLLDSDHTASSSQAGKAGGSNGSTAQAPSTQQHPSAAASAAADASSHAAPRTPRDSSLQRSQVQLQQELKQQQLQQQLLRQQQQALADGFSRDNGTAHQRSPNGSLGTQDPPGSHHSPASQAHHASQTSARGHGDKMFGPETEMDKEREVQVGCAQTRGSGGLRQAVQQAVQMAVGMCTLFPPSRSPAAPDAAKPLVRIRIALPLNQPEIREVDLDVGTLRQAIQLQLLPQCRLLPVEVADGGIFMRTLARSADGAAIKGLGGLGDRGPLIVVVAVIVVGS